MKIFLSLIFIYTSGLIVHGNEIDGWGDLPRED